MRSRIQPNRIMLNCQYGMESSVIRQGRVDTKFTSNETRSPFPTYLSTWFASDTYKSHERTTH